MKGVIRRFGQWAVTRRGLECLETEYSIENARLSEDWSQHMGEKRWVRIDEFNRALTFARYQQKGRAA